jgi:NAD(P)-dependent dehydrogenase (short-subunit alcohol dehydrogenase family)
MRDGDARVWFVTGSTSGFGRALVGAVRAAGGRVVATARRPEALAELAGDDVLPLELDVTREDAIEPALDAAVGRFGRIDVLVNNAGIGYVGALEEMSLGELRSVMETMFFGPAALTRAVVPVMRAQGSGAIVQISSMGGQVTAPGYSAYCAAKFALEGLSEAVAAEVSPFGVRVLIVEPGSFRTGLLGRGLHAAPPLDVCLHRTRGWSAGRRPGEGGGRGHRRTRRRRAAAAPCARPGCGRRDPIEARDAAEGP